MELNRINLLFIVVLFIVYPFLLTAQNTCSSPDVINSLPFDETGLTTCGAEDNYTASLTCGGSYMNGEEYIFEYTAAQTGCHLFNVYNTSNWAGLFLLDGCPDNSSTNCVDFASSEYGDPTLSANLTNGTTYFIIVSTWPSPNCTDFDIYVDECIAGNDCSNPYIIAGNSFSETGFTTCHVDNSFGGGAECSSNYMASNDFVFEFTPDSTSCYTIDISNTASHTGAFILTGCPSSFSAICLASDTPGSMGNPTLELELEEDETYTIVVSTQENPNSCTDFDIDINMGPCPEPEPTDCINALPICSSGVLNYNSNGAGQNDFLLPNNNDGCLGSEHQSAWYEVTIGSDPQDGGELAFTIDPVAGIGEDYDFAVYGPNVSCDNLGDPIRCSYAADNCSSCPQTGLGNGATDFSENSAGDGYVAAIDVLPGEVYYILVDNFESSSSGFNLTWTGDAILDCGPLPDCEFEAVAGDHQNICLSNSNFQLNGSVINPEAGLSYEWTSIPADGITHLSNVNTLNPTFDVSSLPANFQGQIIFTLEVIGATCSSFDNMAVIVGAPDSAPTATAFIEYCVGSTVASINATPANSGTIQWYDADPASNSSLTPIHTGNSFTPSVGTSPSDDIDNTNVGTTSFWITELPSGGCESAAFQIDVYFVAQPDLTPIPPQISCTDDFDLSSIAVTDINGLDLSSALVFIHQDNAGSPGPVVSGTVNQGGQYWVTVNLAGCTDAINFQITLGEMDLTTSSVDATCGEQDGEVSVTVNGGTAPFTYSWNTVPPQTTATAIGLPEGTYDILVTDANNCTAIAQAGVFVPEVPDAVATSNSPVCAGDVLQLNASTSSTSTDISYSWTGPNSFASTEQNPTISNTDSSISGFYNLIITADDCPSQEVNTEVTIYDQPDAIANDDVETCDGTDIQLTGNTTSTASNIVFQWSGPNSFSSTEQNPLLSDVSTNQSGTYTLTVIAAGCPSEEVTTEITIHQSPNIDDSIPPQNSCTGSFDMESINITDANGGFPAITYHEDNSGIVGTILANNHVSTSGNYWILAENGICFDSVMVVVNIVEEPIAAFSLSETEICADGSSEVTVTFTGTVGDISATTFNWDFGGGTIVSGTGAGPYAISWSDAGTGTATVSLDIEENGCPSQVFTEDITLYQSVDIDDSISPQSSCTGSFDLASISITDANGGFPTITYHEDDLGTVGTNLSNNNITTSGDYWILAENGICSDSVMVTINIFEEPVAAFTLSETEICADGNSEITITFTGTVSNVNSATFNWDFGGGTIVSGTGAGPYAISWSNVGTGTANISLDIEENGCFSNTETQSLTLQAPLAQIVVNCSESTPNSVEFSWNEITGANGYDISYTINGEMPPITDNVSSTTTTYEITGLTPDDVVEITIIALNDGICGDGNPSMASCTADDCPVVNPIINISNFYCNDQAPTLLTANPSGGTFTIDGSPSSNFDPSAVALETPYLVEYTYTNPTTDCTYTAQKSVTVYPVPTADFSLSSSMICANGSQQITVTYTGTADSNADYNWDFGTANIESGTGMGPYTLTWNDGAGTEDISLTVTQNNCSSPTFIEAITLSEPLDVPVVSCGDIGVNYIVFDWQNIAGTSGYLVSYTVNNNSPIEMTTSNSNFEVNGLAPESVVEISVTALGTEPCGDSEIGTVECEVLNCPDISLSIDGFLEEYCINSSSVSLSATPSGGVFSGAGVTSGNTLNPSMAGVGEYILTYTYTTENGCEYITTAAYTIHPAPTANFDLDPFLLCADGTSEATIVYTGNIYSDDAIFNWNFNGGTLVSGTGAGPLTVVWNNVSGTANVSLSISEYGCTSAIHAESIQLHQPLNTPEVICAETTMNSVRFEWQHVDFAFSYEVTYTVNNGSPTTISTTNPYLELDDLEIGDVVSISVVPVGDGPCGNGMAGTAECTVEDCPELDVSIDNLNPSYCSDEPIVILEGTPEGGTFSGLGVTGNEFDPANISKENTIIQYTYTDPETGCTYNTSVNVEVIAVPIADFEINTDILCADGNMQAIVTFTGFADLTADFNWDFGGGTASPGTGFGPHTIVWEDAQAANEISLTIDNQGCVSEPFSQTLNLVAPVEEFQVNCANSSTNSVSFDWEDVPNAEEYLISFIINDGTQSSGISLSNSYYSITDLNPQDSVQIFVTALGNEPCASVEATAICHTTDCPAIQPEIANLNETYCSNESTFELFAMPEGGVFYVNGSIVSFFNPGTLGGGIHTVEYNLQEGDCSYSTNTTVEIIEPLEAVTIDCSNSTTNSVSFNWSETVGYDFEVTYTVNGENPMTTTTSNNSFEVDNLSPQDEVEISVIVLNDGICGNSPSSSQTCIAQDCPSIDLGIEDLEVEYCSDAEAVTLTANIEGGIFTINGNESTVFDPSILDGGTNTVEYVLQQGDCSYSTSATVEVVEPLEAVLIDCESSTMNSVSFNWSEVVGYDFEVTYTVNGENPMTTTTSNNSFEVDNLSPQDEVEISVIVLNNGICGNSPASSQTCIAQDCPSIDLAIEGLADEYCSNAGAVTLEANNEGGIFTINGNESTVFDPSILDGGTHTVEYVLQQGDCSYSASATVEVVEPLEAVLINCESSTTNSVSFNWSETVGYDFEVTYTVNGENPMTTTTSNNSFEVDNLSPQDEAEISVIVLNNGICGNSPASSQTCIAQDCPSIDLAIEGLADEYCSNAGAVTLEANNEGGIFTINGNESTVFDPSILDGGTHTVEYVLQQGDCSYSVSATVEVVEPLEVVLIDCESSTTNSVSFNWSETVGYDFEVTYTINGENPMTTTTSNNSFEVDNLSPQDEVEISVIVLNDGICGNSPASSQTCIAQDCPSIDLSIEDLEVEYCSNAGAVTLEANNEGGIFTINGNESTVFDPSILGVGTHTVEYVLQQGDCSYSVSATVEVVEPLEVVLINCESSTTNSVSFNWSETVGYDFEVTYTINDENPMTTTTSNNSFEVDNLSPQDEVEISVIILNDGICGNSPASSQTCIAQDCPSIDLGIEDLEVEYCSNAEAVTLAANIEGGIFTINGNESTVFDPSILDGGTHTVEYSLQQGDCSYSTSAIVEVVEPLATPIVNCSESTVNSIRFEWTAIEGAVEYQLAFWLDSEFWLEDISTDNFIEINNLSELEEVTIEVIAVGDNVCGNSSAGTQTCSTLACPEIIWNLPSVACVGEEVSLAMENGFGENAQFIWSAENATTPQLKSDGSYSTNWNQGGWQYLYLDVEGENGCTAALSDSIFVSDLYVESSADTTVLFGSTVELQSFVEGDYRGDLSYLWTSSEEGELLDCENCPTLTVSIYEPTTFTLEVMDENGCAVTTSVLVEVIYENRVAVPSAFSPNNDGINDVFQVSGLNIESVELAIFNRWGKEVFRTQDVNEGWNGVYQDEIQPIGTYAYYAMVRFEDGTEELVRGNLTLIR